MLKFTGNVNFEKCAVGLSIIGVLLNFNNLIVNFGGGVHDNRTIFRKYIDQLVDLMQFVPVVIQNKYVNPLKVFQRKSIFFDRLDKLIAQDKIQFKINGKITKELFRITLIIKEILKSLKVSCFQHEDEIDCEVLSEIYVIVDKIVQYTDNLCLNTEMSENLFKLRIPS